MSMENPPACVKCKFWSPYYKQKISGWCTQHQIVADSDHWCERHKPAITTKSTTMTPISETVQAALYFANPESRLNNQFDIAYNAMFREIKEQDRHRGNPPLAAAARILAEEVERLRER